MAPFVQLGDVIGQTGGALAASGAGPLLAYAAGSVPVLLQWGSNARAFLADGHLASVTAISWPAASLASAARSDMLASGDEAGRIVLWRLAAGAPAAVIDASAIVPVFAHAHLSVLALDWVGDDLVAIVGGPSAVYVAGWDVRQPERPRLAFLGHLGDGSAVAPVALVVFAAAGPLHFATVSDAAVKLWTVRRGELALVASRRADRGERFVAAARNAYTQGSTLVLASAAGRLLVLDRTNQCLSHADVGEEWAAAERRAGPAVTSLASSAPPSLGASRSATSSGVDSATRSSSHATAEAGNVPSSPVRSTIPAHVSPSAR